jgi:DNA-binding NarL/FixJ family response regulator
MSTTSRPHATSRKKARLLLVDDHPILRQGLGRLINDQADLMVCAETDSPPPTLKLIEQHKPDLVLLDLSLNGGDGLELCRQIRDRWPSLPVLVLSMHDESLHADRSLRAGASGYITKQESQDKVMEAIRRVLAGGIYLSDAMATKLLRGISGHHDSAGASPLESLTDRELQVFRMIAQGQNVRTIAEALYLSPKTIETHKEHIKRKLGLQSSNDLLRYAIETKLT